MDFNIVGKSLLNTNYYNIPIIWVSDYNCMFLMFQDSTLLLTKVKYHLDKHIGFLLYCIVFVHEKEAITLF